MTASDEWGWEFRPSAVESFERLDTHAQERIIEKLDEIVNDQWREPYEYVEPLSGLPHGKIRVGEYRLGAAADRESKILLIYDIEHRSDAYEPGDDD